MIKKSKFGLKREFLNFENIVNTEYRLSFIRGLNHSDFNHIVLSYLIKDIFKNANQKRKKKDKSYEKKVLKVFLWSKVDDGELCHILFDIS